MDERFIEIIGPEIIKIAEEYDTLSAEDLIELKENEAKKVWCVYNSWMDLAQSYIHKDILNDNIPEYLLACVDMEKLAVWLRKYSYGNYNDGGYEELKSGKVIQAEY